MQRVSTNLTLFYKFVLPTFWLVFVSAFTVTVWFSDSPYLFGYPILYIRLAATLLLLSGGLFLYWAVMGLKRVELTEDFVYVTNYRKAFRYPWHNVARIEQRDYLLFHPIDIYFHKPGFFGKKITFLPSRERWARFQRDFPDVIPPEAE